MTYWDKDTIKLVQSLNDKLKIDHSKWHKDKGNKYKRAAELISAGLCHLIISCNDKETIEYVEESVKWLKKINSINGRGLYIINECFDDIRWSNKGNRLQLALKR